MATAADLMRLLAEKHGGDVFVPECKTGPTQSVQRGQMHKMDAWVMKPSWAKPATIAYEVKVTRGDWQRDDKWPAYLACCNLFYFCCPPGVIARDEVPEQAGLIWSSKNATRLYYQKKAPYRDVAIPETIFRYILMSRARIVAPDHYEGKRTADFWRRWLAGKRELSEVGRSVSRALREEIAERVKLADGENKRLAGELERLTWVRGALEELGFESGRVPAEWQVRQRLRKVRRAVPPELKNAVKSTMGHLESLIAELERLEANAAEEG